MLHSTLSEEALSTNKCAHHRLFPKPPWRRRNPGNSTPHIPSLPDMVYLMHSEFPIKRGKNDLESISGNTVSARESNRLCRQDALPRGSPKAEKSLGSQTLREKTDFEKSFLPPEFLSLILSLNHNQLSFKCSLWLGDTYHSDKNPATPATLAYAPAYAIQAPGQSEMRKTDPLRMALTLQPVVWNVVLGVKRPGRSHRQGRLFSLPSAPSQSLGSASA